MDCPNRQRIGIGVVALLYPSTQNPWLARIPLRKRLYFEPDALIASGHESLEGMIHVVLDGTVRLSLMTRSGRERVLIYVGTGGLFGEQGSFGQALPKPDIAVLAETRCVVGQVATHDLIEAVRQEPQVFVEIMRITAEKTCLLLRELERSAFGTAQSQIAEILLALRQRDGSVRLTQERLARVAGKTRVTVGAQLHEFERLGAIRLERSRIVILRPDMLATLSVPTDEVDAAVG